MGHYKINLITSLFMLIAICYGPMNAASIPFPEALAKAAITQSSIDNVDTKAMIIGNGDINALIYSQSGQLIMHLAKNDVWDARLVTENDMPLATINVSAHSISGGGRPPSWNNPYPTQTPPCIIRIAPVGTVTSTKLDLTKGLATVTTSSGTVTIRALMQKNAFYIETDKVVSIDGFPQSFLPAAVKSQASGVTQVKQNLPGDPDYNGMDVYSVLETRSSRHAIALVNTRESTTPSTEAARLVKEILDTEAAPLIKTHEDLWQNFWSKSGLKLADSDMQNWWYRQLYYLRCLSRPGAYPIALQGGYNSKANWHGTWTTNYNAEQNFWAAFSSNHPELAEPFIDLLNDYRPRARWWAKTVYNCEGAASPHNLWPFEPDPAKCTSVNKRQFAYMPWSYGIGMAGHMGSIAWLHYAYKRDTAYLRERIYPVLKEYAIFYASFMEKCRIQNGKVVLGPSVDQEHNGFGWDNSPYDIAWAEHTLNAAIQGAKDLGVDAGLIERWSGSLEKMPYYPISDSLVKVDNVGNYNIITPVVPLFPAEQVSWFSPENEKALFKRTVQWIESRYNKNNSVVMLNVARARLSMTSDAFNDTKTWFKSKEQPNGLFFWQAHGYYMSEQTAVAGLINEFMLQSVEDIIRIFPAWPKDKDASFTDLRAQGGFLVSAELSGGEITGLEITSTVGGALRMVSPWEAPKVKLPKGGVIALTPDSAEIIELKTEPGQNYVFNPALTGTNDFARNNIKSGNISTFIIIPGIKFQLPQKFDEHQIELLLYTIDGRLLFKGFIKNREDLLKIPVNTHKHLVIAQIKPVFAKF